MSDFITLPNNEVESIAIGRFDGLHIGHLALLDKLDNNGAILLIDTKRANLTPPNQINTICNFAIARYELDVISGKTPEEFVLLLKKDFPNLKKIVIGQDFMFGNNRSGNALTLKELFDGECVVVQEVKIDCIGVHSKQIRAFLQDGNIKKANQFLGREYSIGGKVIKGQGIGAQKLLATINLSVTDYFFPKEGIYAARFQMEDKKYDAVVFIGKRLCTDGNFAVEAHLLNDIPSQICEYGSILFVDFIRENHFYSELSDLKKQMLIDTKNANDILCSSRLIIL
ncbi:MAG: bifunctional riboflavin kinase / adenylyltransferase [Pseudomonadota bacterium]